MSKTRWPFLRWRCLTADDLGDRVVMPPPFPSVIFSGAAEHIWWPWWQANPWAHAVPVIRLISTREAGPRDVRFQEDFPESDAVPTHIRGAPNVTDSRQCLLPFGLAEALRNAAGLTGLVARALPGAGPLLTCIADADLGVTAVGVAAGAGKLRQCWAVAEGGPSTVALSMAGELRVEVRVGALKVEGMS